MLAESSRTAPGCAGAGQHRDDRPLPLGGRRNTEGWLGGPPAWGIDRSWRARIFGFKSMKSRHAFSLPVPCGELSPHATPLGGSFAAMTRTLRLMAAAGAVALLGALPLSLALGQGSGFTVDAALAAQGKKVYANKCSTCHTIGQGVRAGPDRKST